MKVKVKVDSACPRARASDRCPDPALTPEEEDGNITHNVVFPAIILAAEQLSVPLRERIAGVSGTLEFVEGRVYRAVDSVVSDILLGVAWIVASVSVVTVLHANTAMYRCFTEERLSGVRPGAGTFVRKFAHTLPQGWGRTAIYWGTVGVLVGLLAGAKTLGVPNAMLIGIGLVWFCVALSWMIVLSAVGASDQPTQHAVQRSAALVLSRPGFVLKTGMVGLLGISVIALPALPIMLVSGAFIVTKTLRLLHRWTTVELERQSQMPLGART